MKKKFLSFALTMLMAVTCLLGLSACNGQSLLTKADYLEVFNSAITSVNNYGTQPSLLRSTLSNDNFTVVENEYQAKNTLQGNTAMLYFLRNLCNTESFDVQEDYIDLIVIDSESSSMTQTFKIRLKMSYDKDNSIIKAITYVEDHTSANIGLYFLEFEFDYTFETKTLNGFSVLGVMGKKDSLTKEDVNYLKYYNNVLKVANTTTSQFTVFANDILSETAQHGQVPFAENLPNYTQQYVSAMQESFAK